ncbi:hypothetical protein [Streptomyces sp. NPDC127084]|uniref:hypothetical protein n=1 Tax=Streptomyces sp. NPDC127084 TaxID=3347133 RepID=UPI003663D577
MTKRPALRRHLPTSPFKAPVQPVEKHFVVGDRVSHDEHGLGRIIGAEPIGGALLVDFGSGQTRIAIPYSGMYKL